LGKIHDAGLSALKVDHFVVANEAESVSGTQHVQLLCAYLAPGVSQDVFCGWSTRGVLLKNFGEKFARGYNEVVWELKLCSTNLLVNSLSLAPLKGNFPQSNAYKSTPRARISAGGSLYSILLTISGAI